MIATISEASPTDRIYCPKDCTQLTPLIKQKTQAYILDKAHSFGCNPDVEVTLGDGPSPVPESVRITGEVPFSVRKDLEKLLEQELGISKENQQWIG